MTTQFTYFTEKILAGSTQYYNRIKSTFTLIQYYDCWTDECGTFFIIFALKSMRNPQGRHSLYASQRIDLGGQWGYNNPL